MVTEPPVVAHPTRGRRRRWSYSAAAGVDLQGEEWLVAAAIVVVGPIRTAFVFGHVFGYDIDWTMDVAPPGVTTVGETPGAGARCWNVLSIDANGGITFETDPWRIETHVVPDTPAIIATPTPAGGWNVTQKVAGERTVARIRHVTHEHEAEGVGWRDWTSGRQDAHTTWRWSAGGGVAGGRRIGWNLGTGMNELVGEHVLWVDGVPHDVDGVSMAADSDPGADAWRVTAAGLDLALDDPLGVRTIERRTGPWATSYRKPFGRWSGTVAVDGTVRDADVHGVGEDHEVRW